MALKDCKDYRTLGSTKADVRPGYGAKFKRMPKIGYVIFIVILIALGFVASRFF